MTKQTAPVIEQTAVPVSRFMASQLAKFERSKISLYVSLILDVLHTHKGSTPYKYAESLIEQAPDMADVLPKYCGIIAHACKSTAHAPILSTFPATVEGVKQACDWLENQARLAGYTLTLQDLKYFFAGKQSMRARADADAAAKATLDQQAIDAAIAGNAARADAAIQATADAAAAAEGSNKRSKAQQTALESELSDKPGNVIALRDIEPGVPLNDGWNTALVTVHTKGDAVKVTGLESLSPEILLSIIEQANALMMAALEIKAA